MYIYHLHAERNATVSHQDDKATSPYKPLYDRISSFNIYIYIYMNIYIYNPIKPYICVPLLQALDSPAGLGGRGGCRGSSSSPRTPVVAVGSADVPGAKHRLGHRDYIEVIQALIGIC